MSTQPAVIRCQTEVQCLCYPEFVALLRSVRSIHSFSVASKVTLNFEVFLPVPFAELCAAATLACR